MTSVVHVLCSALSLACLVASRRDARRLERLEGRVEHIEVRQDRANVARRENKAELSLRIDDIETLLNNSVMGVGPGQSAGDDSKIASELLVVQRAFAEEKTRWRREASKMEDTFMDVHHEVKAAIENSDRNMNNNINGLKDLIRGNKDVLDGVKITMDGSTATCLQNNRYVNYKLSNVENTINDVKHELNAVIEKSDRELQKSIEGIKNDALDVLAKLSTMENLVDDAVSTCTYSQTNRLILERLSTMEKLTKECITKSQQPEPKFSSCLDLYRAGMRTSGVVVGIYQASGEPRLPVYCDMDTDGGGWTVFQRRMDGSVDFFRNWEDYADGFGKPGGEFWLGNDRISALTSTCCHELRIDLMDFNGNRAFAKYSNFRVSPREDNFRMEVSGYSGNASDALTYHSGMEFSTKDRDNDNAVDNCAAKWDGAWWFNACYKAHLNGRYFQGNGKGVMWNTWNSVDSLILTEMKFRKN